MLPPAGPDIPAIFPLPKRLFDLGDNSPWSGIYFWPKGNKWQVLIINYYNYIKEYIPLDLKVKCAFFLHTSYIIYEITLEGNHILKLLLQNLSCYIFKKVFVEETFCKHLFSVIVISLRLQLTFCIDIIRRNLIVS